jgi:predicted DNA-binding transcriptional regulator YafY
VQHDLLVVRLSQILFRLNQGERLDAQSLAQEFNVTLRTMQRDFNERLSYLPIEKTNGKYHLNPSYLGRIGAHNIQSFAAIAGIRGLFPKLDTHFLRKLYEEDKTYQVHGHHYEAQTPELIRLMHQIESAIFNKQAVTFFYTKSDGSQKKYLEVHPYRLINHNGIWYVAVSDQGKLKALVLTRIASFVVNETRFIPDDRLVEVLDEEDGIWLGDKQTVLIEVFGSARHYFERRQLLPKQQLVEVRADSIVLNTQIVHENQLFPILRYWLPLVHIIEPLNVKASFNSSLTQLMTEYLESDNEAE